MKKFQNIFITALLTLPIITSAELEGIDGLITAASGIINSLIAVMVAIALLIFFWGLVKFILAQGSETTKLEAKKIMGWGLVALFVMVSVWGIIGFTQDQLGLPNTTNGSPSAPSQGGFPGILDT